MKFLLIFFYKNFRTRKPPMINAQSGVVVHRTVASFNHVWLLTLALTSATDCGNERLPMLREDEQISQRSDDAK